MSNQHQPIAFLQTYRTAQAIDRRITRLLILQARLINVARQALNLCTDRPTASKYRTLVQAAERHITTAEDISHRIAALADKRPIVGEIRQVRP